jgi:hypothetical protein
LGGQKQKVFALEMVVSTANKRGTPPKIKVDDNSDSTDGVTVRNEASTVSEYIMEKCKEMYFNNIPMDSVKETPMAYKITMGSIAYIVFIGLMVVFIDQSYEAAITQPYVSLQSGSLCTKVPLLLSGDYQGDANGNWMGTVDYKFVYSKYEISLSYFDQGFSQFQDGMKYFYTELQNVGTLGQTQDLATNLIYWMNYYLSITLGDVSSMSFQLSGSPSQVFDLDYFHAAVGSVTGTCQAPAIASYDVSSAELSLQYNYSVYSKALYCAASLNPFIAGYYPVLRVLRTHWD